MDQQQLFVRMALHAWHTQIGRAEKFFDQLPEAELLKPIAPGKNRIVYLLGHLIAVNDNMIALFGLGERSHAHLDEAFLRNPDSSGLATPEPAELRSAWKQSNAELTAYFQQMPAADWFTKHTAMTDEDWRKDPGRNKLSVLLNRTSHVAYHLGQMILANVNY